MSEQYHTTPNTGARAVHHRLRLELPRGFGVLALSASLLALGACTKSPMDWDLRANHISTADEARQATAARPQPDGNGVLSYPGYQMAGARRGENVAAMAQRLNVNAGELARANALQADYPLREGELLILPRRVSAVPQPVVSAPGYSSSVTASGDSFGASARPLETSSITTTSLDSGPVATTPLAPPPAATPAVTTKTPGGGKEPTRHVVKRGETASTIARSYNVPTKSLAEWNNLSGNLAIREGQTLLIPVATAPAPNLEPVPSKPGSGTPTPPPPSASKPLPDEKTTPPKAGQTSKQGQPASPDLGAQRSAASASKMTMPASGSVIRAYNKKSNQGIDIGAAAGSAVKAADAGTVAAITKDTDQVQIVVIRHANNLLTVYAGVDGLKVKKGDSVARGQQIGVVRSASPSFLHFEVRKGVDSIDPMTYLQ